MRNEIGLYGPIIINTDGGSGGGSSEPQKFEFSVTFTNDANLTNNTKVAIGGGVDYDTILSNIESGVPTTCNIVVYGSVSTSGSKYITYKSQEVIIDQTTSSIAFIFVRSKQVMIEKMVELLAVTVRKSDPTNAILTVVDALDANSIQSRIDAAGTALSNSLSGQLVPTGGTAGQVLTKQSGTGYAWSTPQYPQPESSIFKITCNISEETSGSVLTVGNASAEFYEILQAVNEDKLVWIITGSGHIFNLVYVTGSIAVFRNVTAGTSSAGNFEKVYTITFNDTGGVEGTYEIRNL